MPVRVGARAVLAGDGEAANLACHGRLSAPKLEPLLSSFDRPTHMVVRIAICFCSLTLSMTRVDLEPKRKHQPDDLAQLVDFVL
jgi:hypothetical protein